MTSLDTPVVVVFPVIVRSSVFLLLSLLWLCSLTPGPSHSHHVVLLMLGLASACTTLLASAAFHCVDHCDWVSHVVVHVFVLVVVM
jgi:hypothetical protein